MCRKKTDRVEVRGVTGGVPLRTKHFSGLSQNMETSRRETDFHGRGSRVPDGRDLEIPSVGSR